MSKNLDDALNKGAVSAARELLGWELYNRIDGQLVGGRIIETEAYIEKDPASHTYRGQTARNAPMFDRAGTVYIYFTYGMHWCMNIVTGPKGRGEAVLLRGLEPLKGIEIMQRNRSLLTTHNLTNGPAKLVQALAIQPKWSGLRIGRTSLILLPAQAPKIVKALPRIGITKGVDKLLRFTSI